MYSYKEKYLKYKNKYEELKLSMSSQFGGIIGEINTDKLTQLKTNEEIPQKIKDYINLMTIPNTDVVRVGSSVNKIQPFFSDVDVMDIVQRQESSEDVINFFIKNLKVLVTNLLEHKEVFFSDFKAGGFHWTAQDILNEKKDDLTLKNACTLKDVIKLDIIAPYNERYLEMSTFFILKSISEYVNVEKNYFTNLSNTLLQDISDFQFSKPFKAVKRTWSLARINDDLSTLDKLKEIIKSNIALLAQINADIETIEILINHNDKYDQDFIINEINGFKERLSSILDINFDVEKANLMIDNIILLFKFEQAVELKMNLVESLKRLHDYLLKIINKETVEYLTSIQFTFPVPVGIKQDNQFNTEVPEFI